MKKLKEIKAKGLYVFCGKSSANSSFIETKKEAHELINSAKSRFAGFLRIREHLITQDSWTLVCELESEETIIASYLTKRKESACKYKLPPLSEIWRIVSEQVRNFLSRFVKFCNHGRGRRGTLVHSNYERYYFESEEEAMIFIKKIHEQSHDFSQTNPKYRPDSTYFYFTRKERESSVILCSKNIECLISLGLRTAGNIITGRLTVNILRNLVSFTNTLHSHPQSSQFSIQKE